MKRREFLLGGTALATVSLLPAACCPAAAKTTPIAVQWLGKLDLLVGDDPLEEIQTIAWKHWHANKALNLLWESTFSNKD